MPNSSEVSGWYIQKFYVLSNSRQFGMSANPIALSEIIFYGSAIGTIGDIGRVYRSNARA